MTFNEIIKHIDKELSGLYELKDEKEVLFVSSDNLLKIVNFLNNDSDMMFDMIAVGDYEYNEITMEKVKLISIYVTNSNIDRSDVDDLKKQFKVPIYPNASRTQIEKILQTINS